MKPVERNDSDEIPFSFTIKEKRSADLKDHVRRADIKDDSIPKFYPKKHDSFDNLSINSPYEMTEIESKNFIKKEVINKHSSGNIISVSVNNNI